MTTADVYMFQGEIAHVLRYFKCSVGSSSSQGTAADVTSTGNQSFSTMNSPISGSEAIEVVRLEHQFLATHGDQRAVGTSLVTDYRLQRGSRRSCAGGAPRRQCSEQHRGRAKCRFICFERALHERS
jgi:hypothetical protein